MSGSSLKSRLAASIRDDATKLIRRHQGYMRDVHDRHLNHEKRSGDKRAKELQRPSYWAADQGFDPYYVRANADLYAHAIAKSLRAGSYKPRAAVAFDVPKKDGGSRTVSVFQVADNAISRFFYKNLLLKNSSRLSCRAYAYRTDTTLHDAIWYVSSQFKSHARLFIAEFDFRNFFDTISHDFLAGCIDGNQFLISQRERQVLKAFLTSTTLTVDAYKPISPEHRARGIPQGTSVSLFLGIMAGSVLDERLDRHAVGYARFVDDTLIWSESYMELIKATNDLSLVASKLGVELNMEKSPGISILAHDNEKSEFSSKGFVEFVGHAVSRDRISIKDSNVKRIKKRIGDIVYTSLLESVFRQDLKKERVAGRIDEDYRNMIHQMRRYLYGKLDEVQLRKYTSSTIPRIHFRGLMSAYPLVDDVEQLKSIDGWVKYTVFTALKIRTAYLRQEDMPTPLPHGLPASELVSLQDEGIDLRLPSLSRMSRLIVRASNAFGPNNVVDSGSSFY